MTVQEKAERVRRAVYNALIPVLKEMWDDREAFRQVGPTLLTGAVYLMIQDMGEDFTAATLRDMAARVEGGDYSRPFPDGTEFVH